MLMKWSWFWGCRHWYEPTNACIRPKAPNIGIWEYDNRVKRMCLKRNTEIESFYGCPKYECKLDGGNEKAKAAGNDEAEQRLADLS